jgi:hypothetical protein
VESKYRRFERFSKEIKDPSILKNFVNQEAQTTIVEKKE